MPGITAVIDSSELVPQSAACHCERPTEFQNCFSKGCAQPASTCQLSGSKAWVISFFMKADDDVVCLETS